MNTCGKNQKTPEKTYFQLPRINVKNALLVADKS